MLTPLTNDLLHVSILNAVLELGPGHVGAEVGPAPGPAGDDDLDAGRAAGRAVVAGAAGAGGSAAAAGGCALVAGALELERSFWRLARKRGWFQRFQL